jgi:Ca2+-binding RTX toxin-like protein
MQAQNAANSHNIKLVDPICTLRSGTSQVKSDSLLDGPDGNDTLEGGAGWDHLYGGVVATIPIGVKITPPVLHA